MLYLVRTLLLSILLPGLYLFPLAVISVFLAASRPRLGRSIFWRGLRALLRPPTNMRTLRIAVLPGPTVVSPACRWLIFAGE